MNDRRTVTVGPFRPTPAREARAARERQAESEFNEVLRRVEAKIAEFGSDLSETNIRIAVAGEHFDRLARLYGEAGWIITGTAGDFNMELPAPVEGVHPDVRQPNGEPVLDFWRFVHERQAIYQRRREGVPRHRWTTDPVLKERFFTNIFRDLDPGTNVAFNIVSNPHRPEWERLWNLMMYRRFNRESTWDLIGYSELDGHIDDLPWLRDQLRQLYVKLTRHRQETGEPIFTDAHQVYPMPMVPGPDLTARFMKVMLDVSDSAREPVSVYSLADKLRSARTRREAYRAFVNARIPGMSNFLSWQLTMDCTYGSDPLVTADDDWAPITTGARFGAIMWARWPELGTVNHPVDGWPELESLPPAELEAFVKGMRDEQDDRFEERGLDFLSLDGARPLDMPALEHALCEYSKYVAASVGLPTRDRWAQAQSRSGGRRQTFDEASENVQAAMKAIDLADPDSPGWLPQRGETEGTKSHNDAEAPANDEAGPPPSATVRNALVQATSAEERFIAAVRAIHDRGETPTSRLIFRELGMNSVSLNTRQAAWRRDELARLGYVLDGNQYVRRDRELTDGEAAADDHTWD